jgi:hypothetical protein
LTVRGEVESQCAEIRATLGDEAFTAAWTAGQALPLAQAIDLALRETNGAPGERE